MTAQTKSRRLLQEAKHGKEDSIPDEGTYDSTGDDIRLELSHLVDLSHSLHGFADMLYKWSPYITESEPLSWLEQRVALTLHVHAREAFRICDRLNELLDKVHINSGAARPSDGKKGGASW